MKKSDTENMKMYANAKSAVTLTNRRAVRISNYFPTDFNVKHG